MKTLNLSIPLSAVDPGSRILAGAIPGELHGRWCALRLPPLGAATARAVLALDLGENVVLTSVAAPGADGAPRLFLFIPSDAQELRAELLGVREPSATLLVTARPISRAGAAARLFGYAPRAVLRAMIGGRTGWARRVRAALAQGSGEAPAENYDLWTMLFDHWSEADIGRLLASPLRQAWPGVGALVMCAEGTETAAARASLESLAAQAVPVRAVAVAHAAPLAAALADTTEPYVAVLQAGEMLPPHATAVFAEWLARDGAAVALFADEDALTPGRERVGPLFKPEPNRALMLSGTLTRGVWLFRRDWLAAHAPDAAGWAETLRLDLWLRLHEAGRGNAARRLPFLLTHRRADTEAAPPDAIAGAVRAHFSRLGEQARIAGDALPLRVRPVLARARSRPVALMVPTALRAAHVRRCLRTVLDQTDHDALEILLVVSQTAPLDRVQRATLAAIGDDPRIRVLMLATERFNFSAANNFAAGRTDAEFVCLLNDDVAPTAPDWLDAMLGPFADAEVAAVGAKLLYENGTVQHGGIIMGLAGLAEHVNRGLPRHAPGYAHRGVLSQELSAVTGACLLTRRAAYQAVGGLDESFPIAFNDVDYCLKLRAAGHRIVFCAEAELMHYESLSLGHHFSGERAALEREEVRRMRLRWPAVVAADPFHNPNLSLVRGHEWTTAFPPRVRKAEWISGGAPPPGPLPQGGGEKKGRPAPCSSPYSSPPLAGGAGGGVG
jgi:O-antigen biosynthesis protein